jgi:hypothetical protein
MLGVGRTTTARTSDEQIERKAVGYDDGSEEEQE